MSDHELPPLDADIAALLDRAKPIADLEGAQKSAIFGAVEAKLALPPPGGGGGGGGAGGAAAPLGAKMAAVVAATFAAGIAVGVVADRTLAASSPPPAPTASVVTAAPSSATTPVVTAPETPGVPVSALPQISAAPRPSAPAAPASAEAPSARGLAAERALLDVARSALARGEAAEALAAADRHAREYPDGALAEEREAIAIKALVALGRRDEARVRARELERKYPNSLVLRAVKSAVEGKP